MTNLNILAPCKSCKNLFLDELVNFGSCKLGKSFPTSTSKNKKMFSHLFLCDGYKHKKRKE